MATRKRWLSIITRIAVCAALLLGATAIAAQLWLTAPKPSVADRGDVRTRVLVMAAHRMPVRRQWQGYGSAAAVHASDVPSRLTAVALEKPDDIRAGRSVSAGDVLVRLDDSDFARQVEIASQSIEDLQAQLNRVDIEIKAWTDRARVIEEELSLARAEYDRARKAMESDAAKQREVDVKRQAMLEIERTAIAAREELDKAPLRKASLQAQKNRDEATLAQARQNAERCRIVAPISGVLAEVDVDAGESVSAGQRVARIVNLERIEVALLLPSSARPLVGIGDSVVLRSDAGNPRLEWPAQVSRIAPDDDETTRTMRVFAEVVQDPSQPGILAPGMFVQGAVTAGEARPGTVVPRRSINSQRIMLVESGRIRSRTVDVEFHLEAHFDESGLSDSQWAVLRDSLPDGALVVVDGARALADGSPVDPQLAGESIAANQPDAGAGGSAASSGAAGSGDS